MSIAVVYHSMYGNTLQIAEEIAEILGTAGSVRLIPMAQLTAADLEGLDLVVMGCPTHRMNLPEAVRPVLAAIPRRTMHGTPAAAFDTSYKMSALLARFTAARKLARRLRKLGGKLVLPAETFHVEESEGPLYEGELERAQAWAASICRRLEGSA